MLLCCHIHQSIGRFKKPFQTCIFTLPIPGGPRLQWLIFTQSSSGLRYMYHDKTAYWITSSGCGQNLATCLNQIQISTGFGPPLNEMTQVFKDPVWSWRSLDRVGSIPAARFFSLSRVTIIFRIGIPSGWTKMYSSWGARKAVSSKEFSVSTSEPHNWQMKLDIKLGACRKYTCRSSLSDFECVRAALNCLGLRKESESCLGVCTRTHGEVLIRNWRAFEDSNLRCILGLSCCNSWRVSVLPHTKVNISILVAREMRILLSVTSVAESLPISVKVNSVHFCIALLYANWATS